MARGVGLDDDAVEDGEDPVRESDRFGSGVAVTAERDAGVLCHPLAYVSFELADTVVPGPFVGAGDSYWAEDVVEHELEERFLARDVVVERHDGYAQLPGEGTHGDRLELFATGEAKRGVHDLLFGQGSRSASSWPRLGRWLVGLDASSVGGRGGRPTRSSGRGLAQQANP